jgi:hypothetical protein
MYDATQTTWFARETGIQVAFPELWGAVFVGRQKDGISLSKITNGYAGWTMERAAITDIIPILSDGVKWLGGLPSHRANWNFSYYYNELAANPATDWYDEQFVGRVAVLPVRNDDTGTLLHLGVAYQWGSYHDGQVQFDSKPESNTAPTFIDTGFFPADHDNMYGLEVYFRTGSCSPARSTCSTTVRAPDVGNPLMQGGNVFVTYLLTGEQRPYIDLGGKVGFVKPNRSAFSGGPGAVEAVMAFQLHGLRRRAGIRRNLLARDAPDQLVPRRHVQPPRELRPGLPGPIRLPGAHALLPGARRVQDPVMIERTRRHIDGGSDRHVLRLRRRGRWLRGLRVLGRIQVRELRRIEELLDLLLRQCVLLAHDLEQALVLFQGLLRELGRLLVPEHRVERGHDADRVLDVIREDLLR